MRIVKVSMTHEIHDAFPEVAYYRISDKDFRRFENLLKSGRKKEALSILSGKTLKGDLEIDECVQ